MKLVLSVINKEEISIIKTELNRFRNMVIVDVKNPKEGSLGASFPYIIREIRRMIPKNMEMSAPIGDVPNLPGTISLAALGTVVCGVNYVKLGLKEVGSRKEAVYLLKNVVRGVKEFNRSIKVVVVGYGDYRSIGTLPPMELPEIAYEARADVAMIDTYMKDGKKLFDYLDFSYLRKFVKKAHNVGLKSALAGSLGLEDVEKVYETGVDIFGVRGAVCKKRNRNDEIQPEKVVKLAEKIKILNRRFSN